MLKLDLNLTDLLQLFFKANIHLRVLLTLHRLELLAYNVKKSIEAFSHQICINNCGLAVWKDVIAFNVKCCFLIETPFINRILFNHFVYDLLLIPFAFIIFHFFVRHGKVWCQVFYLLFKLNYFTDKILVLTKSHVELSLALQVTLLKKAFDHACILHFLQFVC